MQFEMLRNIASRLVPVLLVASCGLGGALGWAQTGEAPAAPAVKVTSLMHVFSYTPIPTATQADFDAFEKATKELVGKIPGLRKVWVGKLLRPLKQDDVQREYGVAMEFDDEKALNVYSTHPAHELWIKAYERVRVPGTTTIDIVED